MSVCSESVCGQICGQNYQWYSESDTPIKEKQKIYCQFANTSRFLIRATHKKWYKKVEHKVGIKWVIKRKLNALNRQIV